MVTRWRSRVLPAFPSLIPNAVTVRVVDVMPSAIDRLPSPGR